MTPIATKHGRTAPKVTQTEVGTPHSGTLARVVNHPCVLCVMVLLKLFLSRELHRVNKSTEESKSIGKHRSLSITLHYFIMWHHKSIKTT